MAEPRICSVADCGKPVTAKGWCGAHYARARRNGDPLVRKIADKGDPLRWLMAHVDHIGDECLPWPYAKDWNGYGKVWIDGALQFVHRVMCRIAHGAPPTPKHEAAHSCGKGHEGCANPRHVRWATSVQNHADKIEHGTTNRGERQGAAKLTEDNVRQIRAWAAARTMPQREIADVFGIDTSTVCDIHRRKRWGWME